MQRETDMGHGPVVLRQPRGGWVGRLIQAPVSCRRSQLLDFLAAEYTDNTESCTESCSVRESIPWYSVYSVASAMDKTTALLCPPLTLSSPLTYPPPTT